MLTTSILEMATAIISLGAERGWTITTAESCTGGLVVGALTDIAGSSQVLDRGLVTYSNQAKIDVLGVSPQLLANHGAVSPECAMAMALGARARSGADLVVSITGIAGPGGGSDAKPVGMVCFCVIGPAGTTAVEHRFGDLGRHGVRERAVMTALELLLEHCRS